MHPGEPGSRFSDNQWTCSTWFYLQGVACFIEPILKHFYLFISFLQLDVLYVHTPDNPKEMRVSKIVKCKVIVFFQSHCYSTKCTAPDVCKWEVILWKKLWRLASRVVPRLPPTQWTMVWRCIVLWRWMDGRANDTFPDDHKIRLDFTLTLDIIVSTFCLLPKICDGWRKEIEKKCRSLERRRYSAYG